jgi:hypothetical protein
MRPAELSRVTERRADGEVRFGLRIEVAHDGDARDALGRSQQFFLVQYGAVENGYLFCDKSGH